MMVRRSPHIPSSSVQSQLPPLEWFSLTDGDYRLLSPNQDGIICSQVFPGLWLAMEALLSNQMAQVLEVLQAGVRSPEHQAFVQQLVANLNTGQSRL